MKRVVLSLVALFIAQLLLAQRYDSSNSISIEALVSYKKDKNGFYTKVENERIPYIISSHIIERYAFNKKRSELYVLLEDKNCVITLNKSTANEAKKNKGYRQLDGIKLQETIEQVNQQLADKYSRLNELRQNFINDSLRQAKIDSIRRHVEDSIRLVNERIKADEYRASHHWSIVPIPSIPGNMQCVICDDRIKGGNTIVYKINKDSIYWSDETYSHLGISYRELHVGIKPSSYDKDPSYKYHVEVFKDSLETKFPELNIDIVKGLNSRSFLEYVNELKKEAPYGFFLDWGWNEDYSNVSFNFKYMNTNSKTIKYIDVYWAISNAVGDVRKTGHFKGTGPLEFMESASWDWDRSSYYVSGDASKMNITKVIITYMDGTVVTIPKNKLRFE